MSENTQFSKARLEMLCVGVVAIAMTQGAIAAISKRRARTGRTRPNASAA